MVAHHAVDGEVLHAFTEAMKGLVQHVVVATAVKACIGTESAAVRVDIVAEHDRKLAALAGAGIFHGPGDRIQAAGGYKTAQG